MNHDFNTWGNGLIATMINWGIGVSASIAVYQGIVAFWLGVIVTLLTMYKIILDIQIKRDAIRDMRKAMGAAIRDARRVRRAKDKEEDEE